MTFQKGLVNTGSLKMVLVSWSWPLQQFCCKTDTNSSRVSPFTVEDLLVFCLIFRCYFGEYTCNYPWKRWCHSDKFNLQIHTHTIDNHNFLSNVFQYLGWSGLSNINSMAYKWTQSLEVFCGAIIQGLCMFNGQGLTHFHQTNSLLQLLYHDLHQAH